MRKNTEKVYFSMNKELHKKFLEHLDEKALSKSKLIEKLIKDYLEHKID